MLPLSMQKNHQIYAMALIITKNNTKIFFLKILLLLSYSSSSLLSLSLTMALSSAGRQILSAGDDDPSIADINVSIIIVIMSVTITVIVTVIAMVIATV